MILRRVIVSQLAMSIFVLFSVIADGSASGAGSSVAPRESDTAHRSTSAYRIRVEVRGSSKLRDVQFPPPTKNWKLRYEYQVPPLPSSSSWDYKSQVIYQWGDVDFDAYGSRGAYKISGYRFNQIVPQLFIGAVLSGNGPRYNPVWSKLKTWAIEAQYYWQRGMRSYAQTGKVIKVNPGDRIITVISYAARSGDIVAQITDESLSRSHRQSKIIIKKPFPNEPSSFSSWKDFFLHAEARSDRDYVLGHPALDVETYHLDDETMCGLSPFVIESISIPGVPFMASRFVTRSTGRFVCPGPLAIMGAER